MVLDFMPNLIESMKEQKALRLLFFFELTLFLRFYLAQLSRKNHRLLYTYLLVFKTALSKMRWN
jgi:hypothetical protein